MAVTRDAYKRHNGIGRPGHCPGADQAHDGFGNFCLYITLLIYRLITYTYKNNNYYSLVIKILEKNIVNYQ